MQAFPERWKIGALELIAGRQLLTFISVGSG